MEITKQPIGAWLLFIIVHHYSDAIVFVHGDPREFRITTTATATGTSLNKRINEQNNGCARALEFMEHFFAVLCKQQREMTKFCVV